MPRALVIESGGEIGVGRQGYAPRLMMQAVVDIVAEKEIRGTVDVADGHVANVMRPDSETLMFALALRRYSAAGSVAKLLTEKG